MRILREVQPALDVCMYRSRDTWVRDRCYERLNRCVSLNIQFCRKPNMPLQRR